MVKDHLGNVRMVLTEEVKQDGYPLVKFEDGSITNEDLYYENVDVSRVTRPGDFYNSTDNGVKVQLLRNSGQRMGTGKLLKVMSGDKLNARVDYYIPNETTNNTGADGLNTILGGIVNILNNTTTGFPVHGQGNAVSTGLQNNTPFTGFVSPQSGAGGTDPKAYLNILFFDEQFKFVEQSSELVQVSIKGSGQTIVRNDKSAVKNGYAYIFVSNESDNMVYFDNFKVDHVRGAILEETHYYPFGLTMAGISSKAAGPLTNKYKFGGKELNNNEFSDGSGLEQYDFGARNYDPQIGRWHTVDPLSDQMRRFSPYNYAFDNPIRYIDPDGMRPLEWVETSGGQMKWDDRVKDDATAVKYYGEGAKFREKGHTYPSPNGLITLGENRQFTQDGESKTAKNSTSTGVTVMQTNDKTSITNDLTGSTSTNKLSKEIDIINTGLGDKLSVSSYTGTITGKEGSLITTDVSTNNGKSEGGSINIGGILALGYSTDLSVSVGIGAFGYEGHVSVGLGVGLGQVGFGGSHTADGAVKGGDITVRPGLVSAAVVLTRGVIIPYLSRILPALR